MPPFFVSRVLSLLLHGICFIAFVLSQFFNGFCISLWGISAVKAAMFKTQRDHLGYVKMGVCDGI